MITPQHPVAAGAIASHYDGLDALYRAAWGEHVHHGLWRTGRESNADAVAELSREVARVAGLRAGQRVCDVGCGYGATSRLLASEFGVSVTGLTLSGAQAVKARELTPAGLPVEILQRDWLANELADASFDHVIAIESTEHIADWARLFSETYRVLKPGGSFVICAWLAAEDAGAFSRKHLLVPICDEGRLARLATSSEYLAAFRAAGFENPEARDLTASVKRTWRLAGSGLVRHLARHPRDLRYLSRARNPNRDFLWSLARIPLAYATGAMRYGIFSGTRASAPK